MNTWWPSQGLATIVAGWMGGGGGSKPSVAPPDDR